MTSPRLARPARTTSGRRLAVVALATIFVVAGACGSDDSPTVDDDAATTTTAATNDGAGDLAALLPADLQKSKVLNVGSDVAYAPIEFFKEGTQEVVGVDPDVCDAVMKQFGADYSCKFNNTPFDGLIPALKSKRFDVIMSSMSDTKERQAEIDFVDYFTAGTSILVKKGNPEKITSLEDLCGKTIGLQKGTTQQDVAEDQASKCKSAGKGKLTVLTFEKDTDALLQLKSGRTVADMNDFPVAAYNAQTSGGGSDFEVVGQQFGAGPYGIGVAKDNTALRDALLKALEAAMKDGSYAKALANWKVEQGALTAAAVNGG